MRFIPTNDSSKAKCGISSGLKLAGHVSMACATTSHYAKSGLSPNESTGSHSVENILEIVSIDDLHENNPSKRYPGTMGRGNRRRDYMSHKTHAFSSTFLPETSQPSPLLPKPSSRASHSRRGLTLSLTNLRTLWPNSKVHQVSVTHIQWFDSASSDSNFLLLRLSSMVQGAPQWLRLERRLQGSNLKGPAAWINPLGHSLVDDEVVLSSNLNDVMPHQESKPVPRETINKPIPLSFILDVLDAVHKNCPTNSIDSMTGDRVFLSIIMNAIHQFYTPCDVSTNKIVAQSNNPYRILKPLAHKRSCTKLAQQMGLQDGWEIV